MGCIYSKDDTYCLSYIYASKQETKKLLIKDIHSKKLKKQIMYFSNDNEADFEENKYTDIES